MQAAGGERREARKRFKGYCKRTPGALPFFYWDGHEAKKPAPDEPENLFDFVVSELGGDHSDEATALLYTLLVARAQREMRVLVGEVGFIFRMLDQFSTPGGRAIRLFKQIDSLMSRTERGAVGFGRSLGNVFSTATNRARGFLATMSAIRKKIFNLPNLIAGSAIGYGAGKLFQTGIGAASFKENTLASFSTLLGSQDAAQKALEQAVQFAAKTPFTTDTTISGFQTLLTARFDQKDIIPILSGVGDLAALKGFDQGVIDRVLLAFTQIKNKGRLAGDEMLQLG